MRREQDKALFIGRMKSDRAQWAEERIEMEWNALESATPEHLKKWNGPYDSRLRLPIPAYLIGDEASVEEIESYEKRACESKSKGEQWSQEVRAQVVADCSSGFNLIAHNDRKDKAKFKAAATDVGLGSVR